MAWLRIPYLKPSDSTGTRISRLIESRLTRRRRRHMAQERIKKWRWRWIPLKGIFLCLGSTFFASIITAVSPPLLLFLSPLLSEPLYLLPLSSRPLPLLSPLQAILTLSPPHTSMKEIQETRKREKKRWSYNTTNTITNISSNTHFVKPRKEQLLYYITGGTDAAMN